MSVHDLKADLIDVPGIAGLTMRYDNGGKTQVFCLNGVEVRVASSERDVKSAIRAAFRGELSSL